MNKSSYVLVAVLCALVQGCSSFSPNTVKGSGKVVSETRQVSQFDRVMVSGSGHLTIVQGDQEGLTIETDDNLLPLIKSEVAGGSLRIGPENVNLDPTRQIRYELRLKNINALHISGSVDAESASLKTGQLDLRVSGSGNIHVVLVETSNLDVDISGSADIELAGKADHQNIRISGSGNYRAAKCESQDTAVHISGSGDTTVWAHQTLDAHVSGSGDVKYYGAPRVDSHVSGSGSVHSLGG